VTPRDHRTAPALPDSWLSDVAILLADAIRRHPGGTLVACGLLFVVALMMPVEIACVFACGLVPVSLATERILAPRRPIVLPALAFVAVVVLLATFAPDHSAARFLAERSLDDLQFAPDGRVPGPWLLDGAGGRLIALVAAGFAAAALARRRRASGGMYHLVGLATLGVVLVTTALGFASNYGVDFESWGWTRAAILASLGCVFLAASPRRSRWLVAATVIVTIPVVWRMPRQELLVGVLCVGPLAARLVRALHPAAEWTRGAAAAHLAQRVCDHPLRSSFVTYGFFVFAWHCMSTPARLTLWWIAGPEQDFGSPRSIAMNALVPWLGTCACILVICGSHAAHGLLERILALSAWLTAPLMWAAVWWLYLAGSGRAFDVAYLTEGFWPTFLCIAAAFALARRLHPAGRRALIVVAALAAVAAPVALGAFLPDFDPWVGADRLTTLATTAAGLPALALIGALAAGQRPAAIPLFRWVVVGLVTVAGALCLLDESAAPLRGACLPLINALLVVVTIWIARQLLLVTPLPPDHVVFVLGKERAAAEDGAG